MSKLKIYWNDRNIPIERARWFRRRFTTKINCVRQLEAIKEQNYLPQIKFRLLTNQLAYIDSTRLARSRSAHFIAIVARWHDIAPQHRKCRLRASERARANTHSCREPFAIPRHLSHNARHCRRLLRIVKQTEICKPNGLIAQFINGVVVAAYATHSSRWSEPHTNTLTKRNRKMSTRFFVRHNCGQTPNRLNGTRNSTTTHQPQS